MKTKRNPRPMVLVYRIDAANRITWVNKAWTEFARANHGESVMPEQVIGCDLLTSLGDGTVRELYSTMVQHARNGRVVRFDYRCDAPDKRRMFSMEILSRSDGEVEFVSELKREEPRPSVPLLEKHRRRNRVPIRICSWCQRVALPDGQWREVEEAVIALHLLESVEMPAITHGICRDCFDRVSTAIASE